ncbi:MAG: hypothetical protein KC731_40090 [Myxococcales bacterium]|nr:hypothetical protein [Myxococcales bacterium]
MTPTRSFDVLQLLVRHGVAFIVVGMTAGVLQGAPAVTFDLDLLYERTPENISRLMAALTELEAVFRTDPRQLAPNESHLRSTGHKLLRTKYGTVDFLGSLDERPYEAVLDRSITLDVEDMTIHVLSLEELIEVKTRAGRDKDLAVLPLLRATLAARQAR